MSPKQWIMAEVAPSSAALAFPELSPVAVQLLWNRGMRTPGEGGVFLGPDWTRDTHDPSLFRNMPAAVDRVFRSLEAREMIAVHGDYDADGVSGSVVLMSTLRDICRVLGFDETKLSVYIPHREKEGYGFSPATAETLRGERDARLVITVDCGISNEPAISLAKNAGIDTIVCDHHTMPEILPASAVLLHPLVPGETYPNKNLCGTGVAFKLASALIQEARRRGAAFPEGYEKWLLDLVAIATVTDVMPLTGENRVLESFGLHVLNKTRRVGLRKLFEVTGITPGAIDTWTIGFQIGPRINAAGRMRHAVNAFNLLMSEDEAEADQLAHELQQTNLDRQKASDAMYQAAKLQIGEVGDRRLLVAVAEGWSAGLVGLVAGKLMNDFNRPMIVVGKDGEQYVGSGRSVPSFDITAALHRASAHLDRFGGHPQACGFSTSGEERFAQAIEAITTYADGELKDADFAHALKIEAAWPLSGVTWEFQKTLDRFAPFGEGNPMPIFLATDVEVVRLLPMGKEGKHLRLSVRDPVARTTHQVVAFGFGHLAGRLSLGAHLDIVYQVSINEWNGNRELQIRAVDVREFHQ
ncbi:single-stranded-DNA-specific exonuclease RecJ [Candidatus Uhrbacteria bacterium]|nr:single-stranded-DNA-specific exonuclease RecJ [Candidatus Uhrbacteria bacterium]